MQTLEQTLSNPPSKTASMPLPSERRQALVSLRDDDTSRKIAFTDLYRRFSTYRLFGKEPEAFESYVQVLLTDMADYPAEKVLMALKTHAKRNQEPPTTADLVGLIKRNGRPPLKESDIIAIRKKDGADRSPSEWQMLREWEAERQEEWEGVPDARKEASLAQENQRLRDRLIELERENRRLSQQLRDTQVAKGFARPEPSKDERIKDTLDMLRSQNATHQELVEFLESQSVNAAAYLS